jgi:hypothetical protein
MKIPKRLKIGCPVWKVRFVDDLPDKDEAGKFLYGSASFADEVITLAKSYNGVEISETAEADTFLHEVFHCMSQTYGFGLNESQVIGLAGAFLGIIRDNNLDFRNKP